MQTRAAGWAARTPAAWAVRTLREACAAKTPPPRLSVAYAQTRRLSQASQAGTGGASGAKPFFRYLSAWFCPFAHRATLALEHHAGRVEYEWVEALGWTRKETQEGERPDEWFYHWKSDELILHNPSALVPTLIDDRGRSVFESLVCIDFIDQVSGATGSDRLVPEDPVEAARCRSCLERAVDSAASPS